jgi:hypothetical protein
MSTFHPYVDCLYPQFMVDSGMEILQLNSELSN